MIIFERYEERGILIKSDKNKIVDDFEPYFYYEDDNGKYTSIFGKKLSKKMLDKPMQIKNKRKDIEYYENDISYPQRYIIDKINVPIPKHPLNILYFDIETNMSLETETTPEPIISIVGYSTSIKKYIIFYWRSDIKNVIKKDLNNSYFGYNTEKDMLNNFVRFVKDIDPHLLAGWNIDNFDIPYLLNRMKKLKINYRKLSPIGKVWGNKIYGRVNFDMLKAWKILQPNKLESNALGFVGKEILGIKKLDIGNITKAWNNDLDLLIEYNIRDVEILLKLDQKENIINFFDEKRREFGVTWDNVWFTTGVHDAVMLREAANLNIDLPSKSNGERGIVKGATVLSPVPGMHEGVVCFDVRSIYPSIICQFCISPENINKDGEIKLTNGVSFNKTQGFIPRIIEKYFSYRTYYKNKMKKCNRDSDEYQTNHLKQWNYKIQLNSLYGAMGYPNFRLYNKECFRSVTYVGREIIKLMKRISEEAGYKVIAGDTDSVYVQIGTTKLNDMVAIANDLVKKINNEFNVFVKKYGCDSNKYLFVEFEKALSKLFFAGAGFEIKGEKIASKKRYAYHMIYEDGQEVNKMGFVGFEIRRSDQSMITKKMQNDVFTKLLKESAKKDEIDGYVEKLKSDIKSGKFKWDEIAIPGYLNKKKHIIRGCNYSRDNLGIEIDQGQRVYLLYGCVKNKQNTDILCFTKESDLDGLDLVIDWTKMFKLLIDNKLDRIYDALDWNKNMDQKGLGDFV